ncbi:MAG: hypothetical protein PHD47_04065 [Acholeplasmataceae bacterium]|nr:hypothetical protein [Acholeplasmataceae bacterium]
MIILIGASASGKTEVAKILKNKYGFEKIITTTTRPKRIHEVEEVDYHFVSKDEFNKLLISGSFLEVTHYQDNFYGTNKADLKENGLVILEPNGANAFIEVLGKKVFVVFIEASKELRKNYMTFRGDSLESIQDRIKNDDKRFKKKNILRVDLEIKNKNQPLEDIADDIYNAYQNKL